MWFANSVLKIQQHLWQGQPSCFEDRLLFYLIPLFPHNMTVTFLWLSSNIQVSYFRKYNLNSISYNLTSQNREIYLYFFFLEVPFLDWICFSRQLQMAGRILYATTYLWTNALRKLRTSQAILLGKAVCGLWIQPKLIRCRRSFRNGRGKTQLL